MDVLMRRGPSRRALLGGGLAAGALGALATPAPLLAANRRQAKIARVQAFSVPEAVYVGVTAGDGTTGWGEAGHDGGPLIAKLVNDDFTGIVRGTDVFDHEPAWAKLFFETDEIGPGGIASQALAGFDCALWDLRGKLLGMPVWALLGGRYRTEFPLYGSFSIGSMSSGRQMTPAQAAAKAAELVGEGFRSIKVRLGIREENADPENDPAAPVVAAVRRAIGPSVPLYVDANNGYRVARAIEVGKRLHGEYGVSVFEEPVAAFHYPSLGRVADALDVAVAAGEHEYTPWAFRDLIQQGRVDLLNPDVSKLSGLTAARKVAALAEAFDVPISVHNARPTLLTAAHAHFVASAQTATRPQEHPGTKRLAELWRYFDNRILPEGGMLKVPDGPGLGLVVNERALRAAAT